MSRDPLFRPCPYFQTHSDYFEQVSSFRFQLVLETGARDFRLILTAVVYLSKNRKHFTGAGDQACRNWTEGCIGCLWESHLLGRSHWRLRTPSSLLLAFYFFSMTSDHDPKGAEASGKGAEPHIVTLSVIERHAQKLPPGAHRLLNGEKEMESVVWASGQNNSPTMLPLLVKLRSYYVALAD